MRSLGAIEYTHNYKEQKFLAPHDYEVNQEYIFFMWLSKWGNGSCHPLNAFPWLTYINLVWVYLKH